MKVSSLLLLFLDISQAAFLLSSLFIIETTVDSEVSERWNVDDASEQSDTGENDGNGRGLSAIDGKWQFKPSGVKFKFTREIDGCDPQRAIYRK